MRRQILFFVKYPEAGQVKTRLARVVGAKQAARLYAAFVDDMLSMFRRARAPVAVHFAPREREKAMREWLGPAMPLVVQHGADLGERMNNAFAQTFSTGVDQAVLVGSDLPDLPAKNMTDAFAALDTHDAVLAPATDGGYYLIGFNRERYAPPIFENMAWSTDSVFSRTWSRMHSLGLTCARLSEWPDIDTMDDLNDLRVRLQQSLDHGRSIVPATASLLKETL